MFCHRCGEENKDTAAFCRKCGEQIGEAEEETRVAVRQDEKSDALKMREAEPEIEVFSITPTTKFVKAGYVLTAIAALFLVAVTSAFAWAIVPVWLAVAFGLALFLVPAFYHFKQKLVRYTLTEAKLEIDEGFVSRTTRNIPLRRVQDVTVSTNVMQRILGFGDLVIENASEEGGKVVLKNIDSPRKYADILLDQMRRLER